jgi:uncharacterized protein YhfF
MAEITIPFSWDMARAAIEGYKVCTSRSDQKGEIGDTFCIIHPDTKKTCDFRIIDIKELPLSHITGALYRQEGCETSDSFIELWKDLHQGHYAQYSEYFVHWFARIEHVPRGNEDDSTFE